MAVKLLHLTTCPYCREGGGEIRLDLERLASLHQSYEDKFLRADQAPDLNPFVLSSDQRGPGPCNHVIFLSGHFYYLESDETNTPGGKIWEVTCDWWHPTLGQLDDDLVSFVVELTNEIVLLSGGDVPLGIEWLSREWPDQRRMGSPSRRYCVDSHIVFCRDAAAFFKELGKKRHRYNRWWNGEDTSGTGLLVEGFTAEQLCGGSPLGDPC